MQPNANIQSQQKQQLQNIKSPGLPPSNPVESVKSSGRIPFYAKPFKNFLSRVNQRPKRLNSQISTGTTSTYLSSNMSTSSDGLPSHGLPNDADEEEEENSDLLGSNRHSMSLSGSLTPSRSNSNNSSNSYEYSNNTSSNNNRLQEMILLNQRNSSSNTHTNTNSDYLEPVTHNIRQNFEYFNDVNAANGGKQIPSITVQSDSKEYTTTVSSKPVYYNDDMRNFLSPNYKHTS